MVATALVAGVGVAAGQAQTDASELKAGFRELNRHMTRVIGETLDGSLRGSSLSQEITFLETEKHLLIVHNFSQSLFGVPAFDVIGGFVTVDVWLTHARDGAHSGADKDTIVDDLEQAKKDKQSLEKRFDDAGSAPGTLATDFVHLDRHMALVIHKANAGTLSGSDLAQAIDFLAVEKDGLIGDHFGSQNLFGVPASDVIDGFTKIDDALANALDSSFSGDGTKAIADALKRAQKAKDKLEAEFVAAAACSQPKARGLAASASQACPSPSVTLNCPPTATLGGRLRVSGSVSPPVAGESVAIAYTPPGGAPFTEPTATNTAGDFSSSTTATASGIWKTQAFSGSIASAPCDTTVG